MPQAEKISNAITISRPILILLVVLTHIPWTLYSFHGIALDLTPSNFFWSSLTSTIASAALPTLSLISGYLAYPTLLRRGYKGLLGNKARTILLPFMLWNAVMLAVGFYLHNNSIDIRPDLSLSSMSALDLANAIAGIAALPINAPLYFLRELLLCFILSPLLLRILHSRLLYGTLVLLLLTTMMYRADLQPYVFRIDIYFWFAVGFWFSGRNISLVGLANGVTTVAALSFFLTAVAATTLVGFSEHRDFFFYLQKTINLGGPFALLLTASWISGTILGRAFVLMSPYSFTLFLCHTVSFTVANVTWAWNMGTQAAESDVVAPMFYFVITALLTVASYHLNRYATSYPRKTWRHNQTRLAKGSG